jgi:hypothetical protein
MIAYYYHTSITGNLNNAQKHAMKAQEYAEALGSIYLQAHTLYLQARCHLISTNFSKAQRVLVEATQLLVTCDLEGGKLDFQLHNLAAEVHLLKTEYLESHRIQVSIAVATKPSAYDLTLTNLNIALIDIARGMDSEAIRKNLDECQLQCKSLHGLLRTNLEFTTDHRLAELCLRDGDLGTANMIFTRCFTWSQNFDMEVATACLAQLADISTGMNDTHTTIRWAGIFLVLALRSRDRLAIMKAFHCLGQIFSVQEDDNTALILFSVALDGFTFMDVHQWRAKCMVQIADIWKSRAEILRAVELWKAARPLFEKSSQAKDVTQIDAKLAAVEASILEH